FSRPPSLQLLCTAGWHPKRPLMRLHRLYRYAVDDGKPPACAIGRPVVAIRKLHNPVELPNPPHCHAPSAGGGVPQAPSIVDAGREDALTVRRECNGGDLVVRERMNKRARRRVP